MVVLGCSLHCAILEPVMPFTIAETCAGKSCNGLYKGCMLAASRVIPPCKEVNMSDQLEPKVVTADTPTDVSSEDIADAEKQTSKKVKVLQYNRSDLLI